MKIDEYYVLVSEEHDDNTTKGFDGNRGESIAVTSRIEDLSVILGKISGLDLQQFITPTGTCRHPLSIWRENHESTDMAIAFYMGSSKRVPYFARMMKERIIESNYRTGNKNKISPSFYALMMNDQRLLDLTLAGQRLIFLWPWRWNEEKYNQGKWPIESSKNSSADYMNFIHLLYYASPWVKRMVSKEKLMDRVRHYFSKEPNGEWIIDLYDRAIGVILK